MKRDTRNFGAAILFLLLSAVAYAQTQSQPHAQMQPQAEPRLEVPYTQFRLANGLNVIVHEDHSVPLVSVNMWYHVGSGREKPGRTGFAHLFEHLMFEGSANVKEGEFDTLLEGAGGNNNGTTNADRTNYWIDVPSNAVDLALFLESDRMGALLDVMTPERVDGQRDVVKNERRQGVENAPYGQASIVLDEMLYPKGHPYHWPTIGYMEDLTAASHEDVVEFFRRYYPPGNASLVLAGDIDAERAKALAEKWFGAIKPGDPVPPLDSPQAILTGVQKRALTDRVQLPRIYLGWLTPGQYRPGDAALDIVSQVLAGGKNSRLYRRLVYDLQIAQEVEAFQASAALASSFQIIVTPRLDRKDGKSVTAQAAVDEVLRIVDEEVERLRQEPPTPREMERALNQVEASFFDAMEAVGGFGGKANRLNAYYFATGNPDFFNEDLARYRALAPKDIQATVVRFLPRERRVELTVLPES
jgi:zinc protease